MRIEILRRLACGALVLLGACASAPPPPPPAKPTLPALVIDSMRFARPSLDELSFECGRAHAGVELRIALLDGQGRELDQREVRAGSAFAKPALRAGSVVRHRIPKAPESSLKVVGGARPMAAVRSRRLDVAELTAIRLIGGQSCKREGGQVICELLGDPRIGRTLRLRRVADERRGTLEFAVTFNRDFERGVVFEARILDGQGRVHPRCRLKVVQPQVFETQRKRFRLVARAPAVVATLAAVKRLQVTGFRAFEPGPEGDGAAAQEVSLFCTPRPRYRPRATIH